MMQANSNALPESTGNECGSESVVVAVTKCLGIGLGVGMSGIPLYFAGTLFFYGLRHLGITLLMLLLPSGAFCAWRGTRIYLSPRTNRLRGATAYGIRYFFLGAMVGFFLAGCACNVAHATFLGGAIGILIGSLGGAFQGWRDSKKKAVFGQECG